MRMCVAIPCFLSLTLLTSLPATAQGLVQGPAGGGRTSPGSSGGSAQGACLKAVAVAGKDCVLGYGGSLYACSQMGAPGGVVGRVMTGAACVLHGVDGWQCANSVANAVQTCLSTPHSDNCRAGDRSCSQADRGCGRADRGCGRADRAGSSCARAMRDAGRK